ncbi:MULTISPECIES: DNA-directed RNA polymerase subunit beta' [Psychrilyobacter]|uniref:DNA-directed RNA polymerase subunit beta' n=1 Tax=Psychrilyobacter piezotolerans TaxID=2293438 RepID=A0ABX9KEE5_9FUSO|nr:MULTISPECIES: DNA-directed RNA polymerase subunit beta' [Psychrilyobacter]MCS5422719.1 DNA-directed RNA polymerase subunit beta' [Psychrilyobacter sp. S5]NDI78989.1 DNA-directed RNA polymerase subunit beta' [Psychrilyobacter piezotolerans]RDE59210.1 DNA-directed RNA polymerase subunit beta' [Psychrilyobacter sp. S5]REI39777.1 DNA-directed RNA polymerase subunit beta' [Psychrilyobacter piezotolerans]
MGIKNFEKIRIKLASPEKIQEWSFGEVTKPETINYRTLNPEFDGLFCERIFGPTKDWECACGKYKRMRYKGLVCEKCGVEVTKSKVRRERMGHIQLAAPVAHIWYSKGTPNKMALLIGISPKELESVLYFARYLVLSPADTGLEVGKILTEREYKLYRQQHGKAFEAKMGAEGILKLLERIDLKKLAQELEKDFEEVTSAQKRKKLVKRLKVVRDLLSSENSPAWMILKSVPIIPADLRPMVQLDGGRFATSDLNDLYRRVINRNNRLKKLLDIGAPEIVVKNEKRMLQEAVDALIDNGRRGKPVVAQNNRELKSLSDMLKGKQGRFRQNLLGKRVDYSARSVIVVGPTLKLHECGIPKKMALELYKPFIMRELVKREIAGTIKTAKKLVEDADDCVWEVIEDVIADHPVLLNRAPTLHRLSIQAFQPVLIEGKAIRLHPLACAAFNADFDGDQMAVHLVLSPESIMEAKTLMMASNNIIALSNGEPIIVPSQDMVMGCFYMTKEKPGAKGEGMNFSNKNQAITAYQNKIIETHAIINVRMGKDEDRKMVTTTVGRLLFNALLPAEVKRYDVTFGKKQLKDLITDLFKTQGFTITAKLINDIKDFGFHYACFAGITVGIEDMTIPETKKAILAKADQDVADINRAYKAGEIINEERYRRTVAIWSQATEDVTTDMMKGLDDFNPVNMMANSGARGSIAQMRQLAAMRGLMADTTGKIIEVPIKANFREGLTVMEFFMSSHGARKGLADTALRTADSGYLTRRLVDISHEVIVNEDDCETYENIEVANLISEGKIIEYLHERILGRVIAIDLYHNDELLYPRGTMMDEKVAQIIVDKGVRSVKIRSPLTCALEKGVCRKCYGRDLSNHRDILLGEAVGVIAAQSIGEPGTQLTMRTFHTGGVASTSIAQNTIKTENDGVVEFQEIRTLLNKETNELQVVSQGSKIIVGTYEYTVTTGSILRVEEGQTVKAGDTLTEFDPYNIPIIAEKDGRIEYRELFIKEIYDEKYDVTEYLAIKPVETGDVNPRVIIFNSKDEKVAEYVIPYGAYLLMKEGDKVYEGDIISKIIPETSGTKDITGGLPRVQELFEARNPKGKAILTQIDGKVEVTGKKKKGQRIILVRSIEDSEIVKEYLIPMGEHLIVTDGMVVKAGDKLIEGVISPHDVLEIKGLVEAEQFILESVQQVYRDQGVSVNDKHIEIIVKQMFKKVIILKAGGSLFLEEEVIEKRVADLENNILRKAGKKEIEYRSVIQGITKAAVNTDSFISAASFQETTKVLSNAAIEGKEDYLEGLKENVIMGKRIPAGTGFHEYEDLHIKTVEEK